MQWSVNGEKLRYACMVNNMQEIMGIADDLLAAAVENGYMEPYNLFKSAEGILHILMVNLRREEESSSERLKKCSISGNWEHAGITKASVFLSGG